MLVDAGQCKQYKYQYCPININIDINININPFTADRVKALHFAVLV